MFLLKNRTGQICYKDEECVCVLSMCVKAAGFLLMPGCQECLQLGSEVKGCVSLSLPVSHQQPVIHLHPNPAPHSHRGVLWKKYVSSENDFLKYDLLKEAALRHIVNIKLQYAVKSEY